MPSTFSPNKGYNLMGTGDNVGTWGIVVNSQVFSVIDLNFGGRLNLSVAGSSNVNVTSTQARNIYHNLTGLLTGNIDYNLPNTGGFYFLKNATTGAFSITAKALGGTGIVIPQGSTGMVFVNPDTTALTSAFNFNPSQAALFIGGTTGGSANAQTLTLTTPGFSLVAGYMVVGLAGFTNSGATTLAVNGLTAKNVFKITRSGAAAISSGDIQTGQVVALVYDGTEFQLLAPALGTAAFAAASSFQPIASNLTDLAVLTPTVNTFTAFSATNVIQQTASQARTSLGLGTAATQDVGVAPGNVVQLNGSSQLPAVDGSLLTGLVLTKSFVSSDQTITNAGLLTMAHGMGIVPKIIQIILVCQSNDNNYTTGQLLYVSGLQHSNFGLGMIADATNITARQLDSGAVWGVLDFSNGASTNIDNTKWKMRFTAMA